MDTLATRLAYVLSGTNKVSLLMMANALKGCQLDAENQAYAHGLPTPNDEHDRAIQHFTATGIAFMGLAEYVGGFAELFEDEGEVNQ
jgi:hypothetical protein